MKTCSPELELREEKVNAIIHVAGILFGLVSVPLLILNACQTCGHYVIAGIIIYGLSFLMVFTSSTLFHWQRSGKTRELFKTLDHISIYFFIAGTYTPFILIFGYLLLQEPFSKPSIAEGLKSFQRSSTLAWVGCY